MASTPQPWEPDMMNPLVGRISWPVPDNHTISVTLFKDPRTFELEDKDWTFLIEDVSKFDNFFSFQKLKRGKSSEKINNNLRFHLGTIVRTLKIIFVLLFPLREC